MIFFDDLSSPEVDEEDDVSFTAIVDFEDLEYILHQFRNLISTIRSAFGQKRDPFTLSLIWINPSLGNGKEGLFSIYFFTRYLL